MKALLVSGLIVTSMSAFAKTEYICNGSASGKDVGIRIDTSMGSSITNVELTISQNGRGQRFDYYNVLRSDRSYMTTHYESGEMRIEVSHMPDEVPQQYYDYRGRLRLPGGSVDLVCHVPY